MACGELFRVDIKQPGSWMVLWCICWTFAADYTGVCHLHESFFLTGISSSRQHIYSCAALCESSRFCYQSFLPTSTLHHSSGCVVYLFRQLGWNWASQAQRSYPLIYGRKSRSCFSLCSSDDSFSTVLEICYTDTTTRVSMTTIDLKFLAVATHTSKLHHHS